MENIPVTRLVSELSRELNVDIPESERMSVMQDICNLIRSEFPVSVLDGLDQECLDEVTKKAVTDETASSVTVSEGQRGSDNEASPLLDGPQNSAADDNLLDDFAKSCKVIQDNDIDTPDNNEQCVGKASVGLQTELTLDRYSSVSQDRYSVSENECSEQCVSADTGDGIAVRGSSSQSKQDVIKCYHCTKVYASLSGLARHMKAKHTQVVCRRVVPRTQPTNLFHCQSCDYSTTSVGCLKEHRILHTGDPPYYCPVCWEKYDHSAPLNHHVKTVHNLSNSGEPPYYCPVCWKKHSDSATLNHHVKTVHNLSDSAAQFGEPPYYCPVCWKKHSDSATLNHHVKTVHNLSDSAAQFGEPPYYCPVCWKKHSDSATLNHHVKTVHNLSNSAAQFGEPPYYCPVCWKKHSDSATLNHHVKTVHNLSDSAAQFGAPKVKPVEEEPDRTKKLQCNRANPSSPDLKLNIGKDVAVQQSQTAKDKDCPFLNGRSELHAPLDKGLDVSQHLESPRLGSSPNVVSGKTFSKLSSDRNKRNVSVYGNKSHTCPHWKFCYSAKSYTCEICKVSFSTMMLLTCHAGWHADMASGRIRISSSDGNGRIVTAECNKSYRDQLEPSPDCEMKYVEHIDCSEGKFMSVEQPVEKSKHIGHGPLTNLQVCLTDFMTNTNTIILSQQNDEHISDIQSELQTNTSQAIRDALLIQRFKQQTKMSFHNHLSLIHDHGDDLSSHCEINEVNKTSSDEEIGSVIDKSDCPRIIESDGVVKILSTTKSVGATTTCSNEFRLASSEESNTSECMQLHSNGIELEVSPGETDITVESDVEELDHFSPQHYEITGIFEGDDLPTKHTSEGNISEFGNAHNMESISLNDSCSLDTTDPSTAYCPVPQEGCQPLDIIESTCNQTLEAASVSPTGSRIHLSSDAAQNNESSRCVGNENKSHSLEIDAVLKDKESKEASNIPHNQKVENCDDINEITNSVLNAENEFNTVMPYVVSVRSLANEVSCGIEDTLNHKNNYNITDDTHNGVNMVKRTTKNDDDADIELISLYLAEEEKQNKATETLITDLEELYEEEDRLNDIVSKQFSRTDYLHREELKLQRINLVEQEFSSSSKYTQANEDIVTDTTPSVTAFAHAALLRKKIDEKEANFKKLASKQLYTTIGIEKQLKPLRMGRNFVQALTHLLSIKLKKKEAIEMEIRVKEQRQIRINKECSSHENIINNSSTPVGSTKCANSGNKNTSRLPVLYPTAHLDTETRTVNLVVPDTNKQSNAAHTKDAFPSKRYVPDPVQNRMPLKRNRKGCRPSVILPPVHAICNSAAQLSQLPNGPVVSFQPLGRQVNEPLQQAPIISTPQSILAPCELNSSGPLVKMLPLPNGTFQPIYVAKPRPPNTQQTWHPVVQDHQLQVTPMQDATVQSDAHALFTNTSPFPCLFPVQNSTLQPSAVVEAPIVSGTSQQDVFPTVQPGWHGPDELPPVTNCSVSADVVCSKPSHSAMVSAISLSVKSKPVEMTFDDAKSSPVQTGNTMNAEFSQSATSNVAINTELDRSEDCGNGTQNLSNINVGYNNISMSVEDQPIYQDKSNADVLRSDRELEEFLTVRLGSLIDGEHKVTNSHPSSQLLHLKSQIARAINFRKIHPNLTPCLPPLTTNEGILAELFSPILKSRNHQILSALANAVDGWLGRISTHIPEATVSVAASIGIHHTSQQVDSAYRYGHKRSTMKVPVVIVETDVYDSDKIDDSQAIVENAIQTQGNTNVKDTGDFSDKASTPWNESEIDPVRIHVTAQQNVESNLSADVIPTTMEYDMLHSVEDEEQLTSLTPLEWQKRDLVKSLNDEHQVDIINTVDQSSDELLETIEGKTSIIPASNKNCVENEQTDSEMSVKHAPLMSNKNLKEFESMKAGELEKKVKGVQQLIFMLGPEPWMMEVDHRVMNDDRVKNMINFHRMWTKSCDDIVKQQNDFCMNDMQENLQILKGFLHNQLLGDGCFDAKLLMKCVVELDDVSCMDKLETINKTKNKMCAAKVQPSEESLDSYETIAYSVAEATICDLESSRVDVGDSNCNLGDGVEVNEFERYKKVLVGHLEDELSKSSKRMTLLKRKADSLCKIGLHNVGAKRKRCGISNVLKPCELNENIESMVVDSLSQSETTKKNNNQNVSYIGNMYCVDEFGCPKHCIAETNSAEIKLQACSRKVTSGNSGGNDHVSSMNKFQTSSNISKLLDLNNGIEEYVIASGGSENKSDSLADIINFTVDYNDLTESELEDDRETDEIINVN